MLPLDPTHSTIYSPRSRKWIPAFQPTQAHKLHPTSDLQSVIPGTCDRVSPTSDHQHSRPRKWWSHCIAQDAPEMGPAAPFLADMLEESELVSSHAGLSDPSVSHLVAFGKAVDIENSSTRLVDATAFAMGPVGADLGVAAVAGRLVDVQGGKGKVVVPRVIVGEGDAPVVHRFQNPIKQVKFAGGVGGNARPYLAVRTSAGTTIFRQTRLQTPLSGMSNRYWPNRMLSIDENTDDGGPAHADVDFNPWYHRQFGIVDEAGKWRVWDIEGIQTEFEAPRTARELAMGSVATGDESSASGNWGRICWGADLNTIMVAGRRRAGTFDLRAPSIGISSIAIPVDPRAQILDLKLGPSSTNPAVFALTSTSLLWFDMRQPKAPLMNCRHYRHESDALLSLELFNLSDSITNALIYSRMNFLINSFSFTRTAEEQLPVLLGDPYMLTPPPFPYKGVSTPVIYSMAIVPCKESKVSRVDPSLSFFAGFAIDKDLAVSQRIYVSSADGDASEVKLAVGRREKLNMKAAKSGRMVIDSDGESEANEPGPALPEGMVVGKMSRKRTNFGGLYEYAFTQGEEATMTVRSGEGHLEETRKLLEKRIDKGDLGVISLLDVLQPQWLFGDIPAFEESIRNLLSQEPITEYQTKSLISSLSPRDLLFRKPSQHAGATLSIQELYRTLMDLWVHPLPTQSAFNKVRFRRERLCRMIATEIWLSSTGLNLLPKPPPAPPLPPPVASSSTTTTTTTTATSSQAPPSLASPTTTTTTPPESLLRIRTYANVSTPHLVLTPSMQSVLDAWALGSDPSSPCQPAAPTSSKRTNNHRRRRRRSPGEIEGLRADVEKWSMGQRAPPGVLVVIDKGKGKGKGKGKDGDGDGDGDGGAGTWGSQQSGAAAPSSQEGAGGREVTMSQPERGVFGGRRGRPAKKRRTGF